MTAASPYADALARIPVTERSATILGTRTAYWEYGEPDSRATIVMVHGFRGDHHGLEPIVAHLPGRHILVPDLPGFGASEPLADHGHDIDGYSTWLRAFLAEVPVSSRLVVLGHSFGSIVVSATLADPSSANLPVDLLVLVNPIAAPALAGPRGIATRAVVFYYWLAAALPERAGFGLLRNRVLVRGMSVAMAKTHDRGTRAWIHDQHDRYFSAFHDRRVVLEAFRASVSTDVSRFAADIRIPTLLVAGENDDITTVAAAERLVGLFPDAGLHVIDSVGHLIHYETPQVAAEHIRRFLGEGDGTEGRAEG